MRKSIIIYQAWATIINSLSDTKAGKLSKMIMTYGINGDETSSDDEAINAIFEMIKDKLDEDAIAYEEKVKKRSDAGKKGMANRWHNGIITNDNNVITNDNTVKQCITNITDTDTVTDTVLPKGNSIIKRFTPPTLPDVTSYFAEKGITDPKEAEKFIDFYSSKGWMIGKNKMKDWRAAVRNWIKGIDKTKSGKVTQFNSFQQRTYDYAELEKAIRSN